MLRAHVPFGSVLHGDVYLICSPVWWVPLQSEAAQALEQS